MHGFGSWELLKLKYFKPVKKMLDSLLICNLFFYRYHHQKQNIQMVQIRLSISDTKIENSVQSSHKLNEQSLFRLLIPIYVNTYQDP